MNQSGGIFLRLQMRSSLIRLGGLAPVLLYLELFTPHSLIRGSFKV